MPELPEVEVVRRGLDRWVVGRRITRALVLDPRAVRRHTDGHADLELSLQGGVVTAAVRRGKFLWMPVELAEPAAVPPAAEPVALVAHLGMSGQLLVEEPTAPRERHARVILDLEERTGMPAQLRFVDQRLFGGLWLSPLVPTADHGPGGSGSAADLVPLDAAHIARDVLDPLVTLAGLRAAWRGRTTAVKAALLDQSLLSGVGNIYADEALWRARLHYLTPAGALPPRRVADLLEGLRAVMMDALAAGGTSFDSLYVNVNGASGRYALNVYGREGHPCNRCGTPIVREKFRNRSSHFCPRCQRKR